MCGTNSITIDSLKRPYHYNIGVLFFRFVNEVFEKSKDAVTWTWIMRSLTTLESSVVGAMSGIIEVFLQQPSVSIKTAIQVCPSSCHGIYTYLLHVKVLSIIPWVHESKSPQAHTMQFKYSFDISRNQTWMKETLHMQSLCHLSMMYAVWIDNNWMLKMT